MIHTLQHELVKDLPTNIVDLSKREFKLVSNSGAEYDLLTEASLVLDTSSEHFLYDVGGLGYSYRTEITRLANKLYLSNYEIEARIITGTIMFNSYVDYYEYLTFIGTYQNMEDIVYNTGNMLNLQYTTVEQEGVKLHNMIKMIAKKAEVSEKSDYGLLLVPVEYEIYTLTNRTISDIDTGWITFGTCGETYIFPLPSVVNGTEQDYIAFPDSLCDQINVNILNTHDYEIETRITFSGYVKNPRWGFRNGNTTKGGVNVIGDLGYNITIDSMSQSAYNSDSVNLTSTLDKSKENFIRLQPGDNPMYFILQEGQPDGNPVKLKIEMIQE